jgi:hypothetical protein
MSNDSHRVGDGGASFSLTAGKRAEEHANVDISESNVGVRGADYIHEKVEAAVLELKLDSAEGLLD